MGNASFLNSRTAGASGDGTDQRRASPAARRLSALFMALAALSAVPAAHAAAAVARSTTAQSAAMAHPSRALWTDVKAAPASAKGADVAVRATRYRAAMLDRSSLQALAATAPMERTQAERLNPLIVSLPDPDGGFQRFALAESPIMEPGLAAKHPEIKTYAGRGIDDPTATIRADTSPLGFHASVRSSKGSWYIDPYYHLDDSVYASYYRRDVPKLGAPPKQC
jgi:trimeric autotransporter adhesin